MCCLLLVGGLYLAFDRWAAVSLVPGSLIVDTDQASTTLYIHVIAVPDRAAVERFRRSVYATEARIVRAIGSDAEIKMLGNRVTASEGGLP